MKTKTKTSTSSMGLRSIFLDGLLREIDLNNKSLSKDDSGVLFYESSNPFEFFHILNSNEIEKHRLNKKITNSNWRDHHRDNRRNSTYIKVKKAIQIAIDTDGPTFRQRLGV